MKCFFSLILTLLVMSTSFSQQNARYDSLLINKLEDNLLPGYSILVGNFDSTIYQTQYGYADIKNQKRITHTTKFRIGSITKQFTAVCILKLVDEGKLELTTSVKEFVDFIPKKITIEHLLWHTSGLISYFNDEDIPDSCYTMNYTPKELVALLKGIKTISKPDKTYHYSNSGYHILGYIIEQVSGLTYSEYLNEHIFAPLKMTNTQCEYNNSAIENLGVGYEYIDSNLTIPDYYTMDWPYSAGNIVSTPNDLLKWNNALFQGLIVSDSLLDYAHTAHFLQNGESTHYGFGWEIRKVQKEKTIRHSGYLEGYLSTIVFFPEHNTTVVVLTNCSDYSTELFASKLGALAIGKPMYAPKKIELAQSELEKFAHHYDFDGSVISFTIVDGTLNFYLDNDQSSYHSMYPITKNLFYSDEFGCTVTFDIENNSMTLKIGERETTGYILKESKNK